MKIKLQTKRLFFLISSILMFSCGQLSPTTTPGQATDAVTATASPLEDTPTATLPPTLAPTATVYPPVFDPTAIGDNRMLDSFILTLTDKTTGAGEAQEQHYTVGYIKEPFSGYREDYGSRLLKLYWIGGRSYTTDGSMDWVIDLEPPASQIDDLKSAADMRDVLYNILSAKFMGQEDHDGIPANHFTFDLTNIQEGSGPPSPTYKIKSAEGEIYLAQDGNYLLYFHIKLSGNVFFSYLSGEYSPGVHEVTEELSSVNQLIEITVPNEYAAPQQTLIDLGLPLPPNTTLAALHRFNGSTEEEYFFTTLVTDAEFLEFYKNLAPTDGWTVSHIGEIRNHYYCQTPGQACVMLKKGGAQIIIFHDVPGDTPGSNYIFIQADYDRAHQYSPQ